MKRDIFWIGIAESEIIHTSQLFTGSITIFGSGRNNNYSFDKAYNLRYNYNMDNDLWIEFVNKSAEQIVEKYPQCVFMMYYPMDATQYNNVITSRLVATNDMLALDTLDNKLLCREWLGNDVPTVPNEICYGEKIIANIYDKLKDGYKFVIQGEYSCGGSSTWLLTKENYHLIFPRIQSNRKYSVSTYLENSISVNVHIIVYSNEVLILPVSIQIISLNEHSFEYQGADFLAFRFLPTAIKEKIIDYAKIIGERLKRSGYLGVCGIDFIATKSEVFFSEINPRFQSSSFLLNYAMHDNGYNFSIQHLHLDAFSSEKCQFSFRNLTVNYSYWKATYSGDNKILLEHLANRAIEYDQVEYIDDDLSYNMNLEDHTYLFKLIFKRNISAISQDFKLITHPNLRAQDSIASLKNIEFEMLELKIMLLSHGITINSQAQNILNMSSGINCEEFEAIDLIINNRYFINVPYQVGLSELSPFQINTIDEDFWLFYCEQKIASVSVRGIDPLSRHLTKDGIEYSEIVYLGQDRLRIYHKLGCCFKQKKVGCGFCDIPNDNRKLSLDSIKDVIDAYDCCENIQHYLIGGGSQHLDDDYSDVCDIATYIHNKNNKPIYLMSLPINNLQTLYKIKQAGITEVAFNIEIYNREIAKKYMPGKGEIPLQTYLDALKYAVNLWGNTGKVRSIFIVGLEPKESLLEGVENVCKIGVSPILSLFKPVQGTPLAHLLPPSDEDILDIVLQTEQLCKKYKVPLGPDCQYCEDNTLKITR